MSLRQGRFRLSSYTRCIPPATRRLLRYGGVGLATLSFDLTLLYVAVSVFGASYIYATPLSFLVAVSINYAVSRSIVFTGTRRQWRQGYLYFIGIALAGAFMTTLGVFLLSSRLGLYYLLARLLVSGVVGTCNYLVNLHLNFRIAGQHPIEESAD